MKKLALLILALTTNAHAILSPTRVVDADKTNGVFTYRNLVKNDGFEKGTRNWTASGGTFTITTTAGNVGDGSRAASWDSNGAGQTFCSDIASMPNANKNRTLEAGFSLKCASGTCTHLVQTRDGSDNVLSSVSAIFNGTDFQANYTELGGFGTTARKLCVVSVASNEPEIFIDESYMGNARNVGSVAQAELVGTVKITGCSSFWSTTSATYANLGTQTGCSYSVEGNLAQPTTNVPGARLLNQPPGKYVLDYIGDKVVDASAAECQYRFSDGTNPTREDNTFFPGAVGGSNSIHGSVVINQPLSDTTFQVQARRTVGAGNCRLYGENTLTGTIRVYRYPLSSEIAVRPEQMQIGYSAIHKTSSGWVRSGGAGTFADVSAGSGITLTEKYNRNFGTVTTIAGDLPGITFTPKVAMDYNVCANYKVGGNTVAGATSAVRMTDASGNALTGGMSQQHGGSSGSTYTGTLCGIVSAPNTNATSVKLQMTVETGNASFIGGYGDSINWTIFPISQSFPAPNLVGSVTSTSAGSVRALNTRFGGASDPSQCTSSPCTIYDNPGNWVTSVTRTTTGEYVLNLASNTFSSKPSCTCSDGIRSGQYSSCQIRTSLTSMNILIASHPGTPRDDEVNVICVGPRGSL